MRFRFVRMLDGARHDRRTGDDDGVGGDEVVLEPGHRSGEEEAETLAAWSVFRDARLEVGAAESVLLPDD